MIVGPRHLSADTARQRFADRGWLGGVLAMAGAVMLFLGWYGASGAATISEQMPYIASGSIPGAALIVAAAITLNRESNQRAARRTDALIAELHALLVEDVPDRPLATTDANATNAMAGGRDDRVALTGSQRYHRADCVLVVGKTGVQIVDDTSIAQRHLLPCDICEPDGPAV